MPAGAPAQRGRCHFHACKNVERVMLAWAVRNAIAARLRWQRCPPGARAARIMFVARNDVGVLQISRRQRSCVGTAARPIHVAEAVDVGGTISIVRSVAVSARTDWEVTQPAHYGYIRQTPVGIYS